jgi:DNA-binding transcriptional ArsR family regulator
MSEEPQAYERVVSDPLVLRALAHPIRQQLLGLVGREGTITGAEAARQLDISQALASHHLRQLAKYGFVEPAEAGDHRARPWQVTSTSTYLRPEVAEGREASDVLQRMAVERAVQEFINWQQRRAELGNDWVEPTDIANGLLYLTAAELAELRAGLDALIEPLVARRRVGQHADRPPDAEPVSFLFLAIPIPRTEHGG